MKSIRFLFLSGVMISGSILASELIYNPVNPSFGGHYGNSSHLLGVASAINDYKAPSSGSLYEEESAIDRLASSLESRLISQLLADVGSGNTGQLVTDDFIINISDDSGSLVIQLVDKETGETAEIGVTGLIPD